MNKNFLGQEHLLFLSAYANALFDVTEEKKKKEQKSKVDLLKEQINKKRIFIKFNLDMFLIAAFFVVICYLTDFITLAKFKQYVYHDITRSHTYSESFYKNISEEIKKKGQDFSYEPKQKDFLYFKNINNKFELSSWIYNTFVEKISEKKIFNNNILFTNCWRMSIRSYKKKYNSSSNSGSDSGSNSDSNSNNNSNSNNDSNNKNTTNWDTSQNLYNYKKEYAIYSDSSFDNEIESDQSISSTFLNSSWNYSFSFEKTYRQLGGVHQIICSNDYNVVRQKINQNSLYSENYPYFVPAVFLSSVYTAAVTIDFVTFNPLLNILSYHVLKFSFLPNIKTRKKVVTISARKYKTWSIYTICSMILFSVLFLVYLITAINKIRVLGFSLYFRTHYLRVFFITNIFLNFISLWIYYLSLKNLPDINLRYANGSYSIDTNYRNVNEESVSTMFTDIYKSVYDAYVKETIVVVITGISFALSCSIFLKHVGLLTKKYYNVKKNIKADVLYPCIFILIFILGCIFIFSLFEYTLFSMSEYINHTMFSVFIFNLCITFVNLRGLNISSDVTKENIASFFSTIPVLFFVGTISFSFVFFTSTKSFIKRNRKYFKQFIKKYNKKRRRNEELKEGRNYRELSYSNDTLNFYRKKERTDKSNRFSITSASYENDAYEKESSSLKESKKSKELTEFEKSEITKDVLEQNMSNYKEDLKEDISKHVAVGSKSGSRPNEDSSEVEDFLRNIESYNEDSNTATNSNSSESSDYSESDVDVFFVDAVERMTKNNPQNKDATKKQKNRKDTEKSNKKKRKSYFKLEMYLDFFFNRQKNFLPLSYIEKKNILKQYNIDVQNENKKRLFIIYALILIFLIILIWLLSENRKIYQKEKLLEYQIRNISYLPKNDLFQKMEYFYINKNLNIDIKKVELTFDKIQRKKDVNKWIQNCFFFYIQNDTEKHENISTLRNNIDTSSLYKWDKLLVFNKDQGIHIYIHTKEEIMIGGSISPKCDTTKKYCTVQIEQNNSENLKKTLSAIETIIDTNDALELINIEFILSDYYQDKKGDEVGDINHNILIEIHFQFNSHGFISKHIFFRHLFYNHFRIYVVKGIVIHIICLLIFLSALAFIYYFFYQNMKKFYQLCYISLYSFPQEYSFAKNQNLSNTLLPKEQKPFYYQDSQREPQYAYYENGQNKGNYRNEIYGRNMRNHYIDGTNQSMEYRTGKRTIPILPIKTRLNFSLRIFILFLFQESHLNFFIFPLYISLFVIWIILSYNINLMSKKQIDNSSAYKMHRSLFIYVRYLLNVVYLCTFFTILKLFSFLSIYFKKEIIYDALDKNKKQIAKYFVLLIFFYLNFTIYTYFFVDVKQIQLHFNFSEYLFYSLLILMGFVHVDTYLKTNIFYFFFVVLPYVIVLRFLFIYTFLAPITSTCLVLVKSSATNYSSSTIINGKENKKQLTEKEKEKIKTKANSTDLESKENIQIKKEDKKENKENEEHIQDHKDFILTRLSNAQWNLLSEDIKQFAKIETNEFFHFFEHLNKESEKKKSSVLLKEANEYLNDKLLSIQSTLRKIELHWKFHNKLVASDMSYLEKLNIQITDMEEMIEQKKKFILFLQHHLQKLQKEK